MKKSTNFRRMLANEINHQRVSDGTFALFFKYDFDNTQRESLLRMVSKRYSDIAYNNPFPITYEEIGKILYAYDHKKGLLNELQWYFDTILIFKDRINKFLNFNQTLENLILKGEYEEGLEILNQIDEEIGTSLYSMYSEFYINENSNNNDENKAIVNNLHDNDADLKTRLLAEFSRVRIESNISSWQYDTSLEQHKLLYDENNKNFLDYVIYKLEPFGYELPLNHLAFIAAFDSDLAMIDRYFSIKRLLILIILSTEYQDIATDIHGYFKLIQDNINDSYWNHCTLFDAFEPQPESNRAIEYYQIQDLFFLGDYKNVLICCKEVFSRNPNYSECYLFFVQSLLFTNSYIDDFIDKETDLIDILNLIKSVLEKNENYTLNREKLLKKYYSIAHFDFSYPILEFILNEFRLANPKSVRYTNFCFSTPIRYNFYKEITNNSLQIQLTDSLSKYSTFAFINSIVKNQSDTSKNSNKTFFCAKISVGYLMSINHYEDALIELNNFYQISTNTDLPDFVATWYIKNSIKCEIILKRYEKAADLIVDYFFKKNVAYDHFYDVKLFESLSESDNEQGYKNISIPIIFQIYNQPNAAIYDSIANFLINNDVEKPSELLKDYRKWDTEKFIFLVEKCFTKENIDDSPFLNTIEALEQERIILLNFLKDINPTDESRYNEEILKITKEASIRKGLMQIHESRIYVDITGLKKNLQLQFNEFFERYLDLSDITLSTVYSAKLGDENIADKVAYYFLEPIPEILLQVYDSLSDYRTDPNVVKVPYVKYLFFDIIFNSIKEKFVYDEDYGFKSFLSMRIRHGTFSNVLRNVFDRFNLISSKESNSQDYGEVSYWVKKFPDDGNSVQLQSHLKKFSEQIDLQIDEALAWVKVMSREDDKLSGMFNFTFSDEQLINIFRNRIGRLSTFSEFIEETFDVMFERLELSLSHLRKRISDALTPNFLLLLNNLQKDVESISFEENERNLINKEILDCSTEIQVVTAQVVNWFKISKNQYIEEFPLELILNTILDYMNSINQDTLTKAELNIVNNCHLRFKGKYFESFGDIFINLFDNIISKNKDIDDALKVVISIERIDEDLQIIFKNNIAESADKELLDENIEATINKIEKYKNEGSSVSFEQGSGFLKICKSIAINLERQQYSIVPKRDGNNFEVAISFSLKNLTTDILI